MKIDVVITTYNREKLVLKAIASAFSVLEKLNGRLIVVDDASTDQTISEIYKHFAAEIGKFKFDLICLEKNIGVTGAKNSGYNKSSADWVIFLDSDDELDENTADKAYAVLKRSHAAYPVVFFRCIDQNGSFVGQAFDHDKVLELPEFIEHASYGESLPVLNKSYVPEYPFDTDLRGHEGYSLTAIIKKQGAAFLSKEVFRVYHCENDDRLSTRAAIWKRSHFIARGYKAFLFSFFDDLTWQQKIQFGVKYIIYSVHSVLFRT